jgi:hypothetical protein
VQTVLSNPELLRGLVAQLAPAAPAPAQPRPAAPTASEPAKAGLLRTLLAGVRAWASARLQQVGAACGWVGQRVGNGLSAVRARLWLVRRFKAQLLAAVGVGTAAGLAAYFAGPWLAASVAWLGGFGATLAASVGLALRRWAAAVGVGGQAASA